MISPLRISAAALSVVCIIAALLGASVARATADAGDSSGSGLTVTPSHGLFDVELAPGQVETRIATVTNLQGTAIQLHLTPVVTEHQGDRASTEQVLFAANADGTCPDTHDLTLTGGGSISHGALAAGESRDVCISVELPADATPAPPGTVTADLVFTTMAGGDAGADGRGGPSLAQTGGVAPLVLLGVAGAALLTGTALSARRKQISHA
ncbi:hypothetical protein [Leucobacter japonicus]|uniref:hypothetical protein n=1 Tax=Leucobacter japonicus TaxID=1461259 RepID=UPI0006A7B579|nr:hypothetical protein [Leucobacter japonicus]